MAKLKAKQRKKLPKSKFALPGERKYPVTDRAHAANAKARATQMFKRGRLSESGRDHIRAMANKMLNYGKGKAN